MGSLACETGRAQQAADAIVEAMELLGKASDLIGGIPQEHAGDRLIMQSLTLSVEVAHKDAAFALKRVEKVMGL